MRVSSAPGCRLQIILRAPGAKAPRSTFPRDFSLSWRRAPSSCWPSHASAQEGGQATTHLKGDVCHQSPGWTPLRLRSCYASFFIPTCYPSLRRVCSGGFSGVNCSREEWRFGPWLRLYRRDERMRLCFLVPELFGKRDLEFAGGGNSGADLPAPVLGVFQIITIFK